MSELSERTTEKQVEAERRHSQSKPAPSRTRIPSLEELLERRGAETWTVFSACQNLPAALNDPLNRETDLFTRTWGDSFSPNAPLPPSPLPKIELGDFLRYLKETSSVGGVCVSQSSRYWCLLYFRDGNLTDPLLEN